MRKSIPLNIQSEVCIESCVRGHHVYKQVWAPFIGEELVCKKENGNEHDPYAVAVMQRSTIIVGQVPTKMSAACYLFSIENTQQSCVQFQEIDAFQKIYLKDVWRYFVYTIQVTGKGYRHC